MTPSPSDRSTEPAKPHFETFYHDVYLDEHTHPLNVALHIGGTLAGMAFVAAVLALPLVWYPALLLFPVVHAAPGLLGHRLFEPNEAIGDARWQRTDFPLWWFIAANHRFLFEKLLRKL